ncbi:hypothetical protein [Sneathiella glossodoripedis]|uniref:hypothetical protein n=1 Tax=Sneathiella glossodoripedis TaxID=418853 RepID=UPI000470E060|nr:hypothetical protein [Sneathiella glossodoripedis]
MSKDENTESRIEAALQRLHNLSTALSERPAQTSLIAGDDPVLKAEMDSLRVENQLLRQELLELTASYNGLKQATDAASSRLDKTIADISGMLEQ